MESFLAFVDKSLFGCTILQPFQENLIPFHAYTKQGDSTGW